MKLKNLWILLFFLPKFTEAQPIELFKISQKFDSFTTDRLGNIYLINGEEISKYDLSGKFLQKNSFKEIGKPIKADASNPLKIMLYGKDLGRIIYLDNMMAPGAGKIDLYSLGYDQATAACVSHDDGIWIYDQEKFELIRLDASLNISNRTGNIFQLTGNVYNPDVVIENNNLLILQDSAKGTLVFDTFGTLMKQIAIRGKLTQVEDKKLFYLVNNEIVKYDIELLQQSNDNLPLANVQSLRVQKNRLFLASNDQLIVYQIQP